MKRLLIVLLIFLCLVLSIGYGQTAHVANSFTVTWDPCTQYVEGDPIDPLDLVTYQVYLRERHTGATIVIQEISEIYPGSL